MALKNKQTARFPNSALAVGSELALVAFTLAATYSFSRLFVDQSYFRPVATAAVTAHVLAAIVRWVWGGVLVSLIVSIIGLVISTAILFPPFDSGPLLDAQVLRGIRLNLEAAFDQFQRVTSPTEVSPEFSLLIAIAMWLVAFLSDWAAFRLRAPAEALIPGAAVFIFGSLFAADQYRLQTAVVILLAGLIVVLLHRLTEAGSTGTWLGQNASKKGQYSMLRIGVGLVALTMIAAIVSAPIMPGYAEEPVWDVSDLDEEPDPRVVISPLVDIRARLIDQTDAEVFTVQSPVRDYWRITSLDIFDGRIWRSRGAFDKTSGPLDTNLPDGTRFESVTQSFNITGLARIWLPAAYEPAELLAVPEGVGLEYEPDSGTLIVNRDSATSDGLSYAILSAIPTRDLETIQSAGSSIPAEISERYLDLPANFSARVTAQAEEIVTSAGAETPYEKAIALQSFFRDPSLFSYDLEVASGHSADRLEDFLFEVRVGYCEQFSGAFAAMARSIGLPSRVAVGFTPGEFDASIDAYRVTGKHAHAWPEVWIDNIGWLRFEPTPGRGAPGDEAYTGVPEQQASNLPGNAPTTAAGPQAPVAQDDRTFSDGSEQTTTTLASPQSDRGQGGTIGGEPGVSTKLVMAWLGGTAAFLMLALLPLLWGLWRARRTRARVGSSAKRQVGLAWAEARSALRLLGFDVSDADTPAELVERVGATNPEASGELQPIADRVVQATYGETSIDKAAATEARAGSQALAARARNSLGLWKWWGLHASPVNVWRDKEGLWGSIRPEQSA